MKSSHSHKNKIFKPQTRINELELDIHFTNQSLERLHDFQYQSKEELIRKGYFLKAVTYTRTFEDIKRYDWIVSHLKTQIIVMKKEIELLKNYF